MKVEEIKVAFEINVQLGTMNVANTNYQSGADNWASIKSNSISKIQSEMTKAIQDLAISSKNYKEAESMMKEIGIDYKVATDGYQKSESLIKLIESARAKLSSI